MESGAKLTLSDDAHGTGDVGFWYNNLSQYLTDNRVTELHYLVPHPQKKVVCRKIVDCLSHPFWTHCREFLEENYSGSNLFPSFKINKHVPCI